MTYEEAIQILENDPSVDDIQRVAREWTKEHGFDSIKDTSGKELMAFAPQSPDDAVPTLYSYRQHAWTKISDVVDATYDALPHGGVIRIIRMNMPCNVQVRVNNGGTNTYIVLIKIGGEFATLFAIRWLVEASMYTYTIGVGHNAVSWAKNTAQRIIGALNEHIKLSEEGRVAASNLNRLRHWMDNKDIAVITAFRNEIKDVHDPSKLFEGDEVGHKLKVDEKKLRNRILKEELRSYGYGVTSVSGVYTGADGSDLSEDSFLVVNLNNGPSFKKNLFDLSERFNQDSFLYKGKDKDAMLIHTNDSAPDDNPYGKEEPAGKFYENVLGDMMSRINNKGFAFITEENKSKYQEGASKTWKERKDDRSSRLTDSVIEREFDSVKHPTEMRTVLSNRSYYTDSYKQLRDSGIPPVKHMSVKDGERWNLSEFPNSPVTGSARGMREQFYGNDALLVRCGDYIYNVSSEPEIYENASL